MTNIVLIARDRPRLVEQCLRTLYMHTPISEFTLCLINDGSATETTRLIEQYAKQKNCEAVHIVRAIGVVGFLKNLGVWVSERCFGRGDWLYIGDSDTCFSSGWLERLAMCCGHGEFKLMGGQVHPYHHPEDMTHIEVPRDRFGYREYKMLDGPSWLMPWSTWDTHGPLDQDGPAGVCKGEDVTFCNRITAGGGRIGVIHPHVVHHTGLRQTDGNLAPGADLRRERQITGVIYE